MPRYPDYYEKPFHAYPSGNLCWEAALEVTMAAKSVHAFVMDPDGKTLDPEVGEGAHCIIIRKQPGEFLGLAHKQLDAKLRPQCATCITALSASCVALLIALRVTAT